MKKSEMRTDTTYILCPDPKCKLFFKPDCTIPCERDCPKEAEMKKLILCVCGEIVVSNGDHGEYYRVEHDCANGNEFMMGFLINWTDPGRGSFVPSRRNRLQRLKALGNAVVPAQVYPFFKYIAEIESDEYNTTISQS